MIDLLLVGIGSGNPDHLTLQAIKALNSADLILIPEKGEGKEDLADMRRVICSDLLDKPGPRLVSFDLPVRNPATPGYKARVSDWHDAIAEVWKDTILAENAQDARVALLVWGDPSLYDSTLRIAERLGRAMPVRVTVIPGLTSLQVLTAVHAIPLNQVGAPVTITTGRRLRDEGWPEDATTVAVMLDGEASFQSLDPAGLHIWWGAFVGMPDQALIEGPLAEVATRIADTRARLREAHGWVMDIYLLRRA